MSNGTISPVATGIAASGRDHLNAAGQTNVLLRQIDRNNDKKLCIHQAIARRSKQSPKSEAISAWDAKWTYEELEDLASRLANRLISLGIGPESLVPFCFEKSAWAIVAILGVLKAGGAFVPLDPTYPVDRLRTIINETKARIVLSSVQNEELCRGIVDHTVVVNASAISDLPVQVGNEYMAAPDNAAYVIFTSGSTGRPKGCIVEHRAFYSCALAHGPAHRVCSSSRVLQFASYTFDACLVEILTTFIFGGVVCIPSTEARLNDLVSFMNSSRVNLAILTPSVASLLKPTDLPLLETLVMVGEPVKKSHVSLWSTIPNLLCAYGPTETAVSATVNPQLLADSPANIGSPVGCHIRIVDPEDHNKLVVSGDVGELLIIGKNLARGYLNDPEKTTASFVNVAGERAYKTGDLVREGHDGSLQFVARKDTQIKINGQRVEPGEIEECIQSSAKAAASLVLIPREGLYKMRLIAVVRLKPGCIVAPEGKAGLNILQGACLSGVQPALLSIREHLALSLPLFMRPSLIIPVWQLPLLASGKIDRNGITRWIETLEESTIAEIDPTMHNRDLQLETLNMVESLLINIWSEVLNIPVERIDPNLSFISLGGDSISAMQIRALCREKRIATNVHDILRFKTIRKIAPHVKQTSAIRPLLEPDDGSSFNLSPIQRMFFEAAPYGENHFNQSFLLFSNKTMNQVELRRALDLIVARHDMLRARFHVDEAGRWMQSISPEISTSHQFAYHQVSKREEIEAMAEDAQKMLDIRHGPVVVSQLFHFDQKSFLSITVHHATFDLVSWRVILNDLESVLRTPNSGLQKPVMPFRHWLKLQENFGESHLDPSNVYHSRLPSSNLSFWAMHGQANKHFDKVESTFILDTQASGFLLRDGPRLTKADTNEILLASLICAFAKVFPDRETPVPYVEGHGRETWDANIDITETVGWFTTLHPVLVKIDTGQDFIDVIRYTKDAHRSVPWKGWGYFTSRYLNSKGRKVFKIEEPMEIVFNFSGSYHHIERPTALFQQVPWSTRESVAGRMERFSLFEISVDVSHDRLACTFVWNSKMAHQTRIIEWIDSFRHLLSNLSTSISRIEKHPYSPSDFPYAKLTYESLGDLVSRVAPELNVNFEEDVDDIYVCTPMQQGILLSQAKSPSLYVTETIWMVEMAPGNQNIETSRLAAAWGAVVARHANLRTVFFEQNTLEANFLQVVLKNPRLRIAHRKWDGPEPPQPGARIAAYKPGDLLHSFTIFRGCGDKIFCSLKISHAMMDGLSIDNIVYDMLQAYDGKLSRQPPIALEEYFIHVQDQQRAPALQYWKARLYGAEPCYLPKLNDLVNPHSTSQALRSIVNESDASYLWAFCERHGITMPMLFHFGWSLIVQAFTGSSDILFGYLTSGRDIPIKGIEGAVGAFANLLVCRIKLDSASTVVDMLNSLQSQMVVDREHQFLSLGDIQHALGMHRPLFNSILSYQKHEMSRVAARSSIEFEKIGESDPSEYGLALGVHEFDKRLFVKMEYLSDLLSTDHASHVLESFQAVLLSITKSPTGPLSCIEVLSTKGRERIIEIAGPNQLRAEGTIQSAFVNRARIQINDPAVDSWDAQWTYGELLELCCSLRRDLSKIDITTGTVVPLCFEKSAWTIVAMIGVLMAGGSFVLLDTSQPAARLQRIIDQVSPRLIISSRNQESLARNLSKAVYILEPEILTKTQGRDVDELALANNNSNDSAFIVFTSGSTGNPKGVILSHSAFVSAAQAHTAPLKLHSSSRVLQFASYSFDACLLEMLTTLTVGGVVCIPSEGDRWSNLAHVIKNMRITWANLTPLVAELLLEDDLPLLQTIVIAGETMSTESIRRWKRSSIEIINGYGPTETCIAATLNPSFVDLQDISNIGRPIGCRSWVVNEYLQAVPIGAVGELILEGPTLATGYLGDISRTEAAFIKPPVWLPTPFDRVYRTGDLVRYESDGSLSFVGRKDTSQIKIRGQRVELDAVKHEISKMLDSHFQLFIEFALVDKLRRRVLIAFLTENPPDETGSSCALKYDERLKNQLEHAKDAVQTSLPAYMVPELYIPLSNVPLMPSGKLNRRLLHEMVRSLTSSQMRSYSLVREAGPIEPPSSSMERTLANMWAQLIKCEMEEISRQSNFFHIGADSVAAMKLTSLSRSQGMHLTVTEVFQNPRLFEMAIIVEANHERLLVPQINETPFSLLNGDDLRDPTAASRSIAAAQCGVSISQIQDAYPCSPQQESLVAAAIRFPGSYITKHSILLPQAIDMPRFMRACELAYAGIDILRTRIFLFKAQMLQAVIEETLSWVTDEEQSSTPALADFGARLSVFAVGRVDDERHVFTLTMHHAIYDGWSLQLLFKCIEQWYRSSTQISPAQYKDFIAYITTSRSIDAERFWCSELADSSPTNFPTTKMTGPYHLKTKGGVRCELPDILDITKSVIIRAAWTLAISHLTTSNDIVFGAVLNGRNTPIISAMEIIGPMVATVPVRVKFKREQSVSDLLDQMQRQATETILYEHTGLQKIKQMLENENATNFTSLLVVQSAESGIETFTFLDSSITPDDRGSVDVYPLILEFAPYDEFGMNIAARYDPTVVPETELESVLHILQDVCLQLGDQKHTKSVGDIMSYLQLYHKLDHKEEANCHEDEQDIKANGNAHVERHTLEQSIYENELRDLWAVLLDIPVNRIDRRSNFLHLGGDSIVAIKLSMAARSKNLVLPVATIFSSPVLAVMALSIQPLSAIQPEIQRDLTPFSLLTIQQDDSLERIVDSCTAQCNLSPTEVEDIYPCTPLQEGFLALSQKQPGTYIAQQIWRIPRTINRAAFIDAWETVSLHHGILRSRIIVHESKMLQALVKSPIRVEHSTVKDPLKALQKVVFSPGLGDPLAQYLLLDDGEENTYFIFSAHHAIFDAWSLPLLFQDVGKLYNNRAITLPVAFNVFVHHVMKSDMKSNLDFWRRYFSDLDLVHFPKPLAEGYHSETNIEKISLQIRLQGSVQAHVTTAALLRAAWSLTLSHYTNTDDVVFWSTLHGRDTDLPGITEVDGPTLATIPTRMKVIRDESVYNFLTNAQDDLNSITPFQHFGIQNIRQASDDALKACDATTHLMIQAEEEAGITWLDLEQIHPLLSNYTSYPLALDCRIRGDEIETIIYANSEAMSRIDTERVIEHFTYTIQQLSESEPDRLLGEVEKISSHAAMTLKIWNKHVPKMIHKTIHEVIHDRSKSFALRPAVCAWDAEWTHEQLDSISSRLALQLKEVGVTPESIVPVCFERSAWMVVGMLAVLKAGGAFLPWDPAHPEERRSEMVRQTNCSIILTTRTNAELCAGLSKVLVIVDPVSLQSTSTQSLEATDFHRDCTSAAYLIYTSGSTGRPKGVVITHEAYSSSGLEHGPVHQIGPTSRVLQFASYSVDAICLEILTTLMMGGCTCIPSSLDRDSRLQQALRNMEVSVLALTPSVLSVLAPEDLPSLKTCIMVGEPAPTALVERWAQCAHLINGYGPTETSLAAVMNQKMTAKTGANIGRAVGCATWIVDPENHDKLVPIGAVGELLIEGPTLARGYLHDQAKTDAAFILNPPWLSKPGTKLYKTGDLVKYADDETIIFVGRKDSQVKVNGQRVELREIEHHIKKNMVALDQVVVEASRNEDGRARTLVAFLTIKPEFYAELGLSVESKGAFPTSLTLETELKTLVKALVSFLPVYMMPTMWVPLYEIPVATSGKVDRKRLVDQANMVVKDKRREHFLSSSASKCAPETSMAVLLQKLWAEVLRISADHISADDSFFRVGGDSIAAMKLSGLANARKLRLSVQVVFEYPVLRDMADQMELNSGRPEPDTCVSPGGPLPFSLVDRDEAVLKQIIYSRAGQNNLEIEDVVPATDFQSWAVGFSILQPKGFVTYMILTPSEPFDYSRLSEAIRATVATIPILRTGFFLEDGHLLQVIFRDFSPKLDHHKSSISNLTSARNEWLSRDTERPTEMLNPVTQFTLLSTSLQNEQCLILRLSHAQYDGVSFPRVWETLHKALSSTEISPQPSFSALVEAVHGITHSQKTLNYWSELLKDSSMTPFNSQIKPTYAYPLNKTHKYTIPWVVEPQHQDFTQATVVKAAWTLVLSHLNSTQHEHGMTPLRDVDITFGTLVSGRAASSIPHKDAIGPFLNIAPVRVKFDFATTLNELVMSIQKQHTASLPYENMGFRDIIRTCTNWPSHTRFSSVVQHQNLPEIMDQVNIGDLGCHSEAWRKDVDSSDIAVLSTPLVEPKGGKDERNLQLEIGYCDQIIDENEAMALVECLGKLVQIIVSDVSNSMRVGDILSKAHVFEGVPNHPYYAPEHKSTGTFPNMNEANRDEASTGEEDTRLIEADLLALWRKILKLQNEQVARDVPFSDHRGGDFVATCLLTEMLRQRGYHGVSVQEMLVHDSVARQASLLLRMRK